VAIPRLWHKLVVARARRRGSGRPLLAALAAPALAVSTLGCGTSDFRPLNRTVLRATHPKTLAIAVSRSPKVDITAGGAGWGFLEPLVGVKGQSRTGEKYPKHIPIQDPVVAIREEVASALAKRFDLQVEGREDFVTKASTPDGLAKDYPTSDLILDIRTREWTISQVQLGNSTNADHVAIRYQGVLRLVDARQKAVIAQSTCTSIPVDSPDLPTLDEFLANDGALFHSALAEVGAYCADDYRTRVLGLY